MLPVVRSFRTILRHPLTLAVYLAFLFASAAGVSQSLRFVPPIYTVPLPSLNMLSGPTALATDVHGNVYMLDTGHSQVLKVDTSQTTTIFAGTGSGTYSGDNGLAVNASLHLPNAIAVDLAGNVFIADTNNLRSGASMRLRASLRLSPAAMDRDTAGTMDRRSARSFRGRPVWRSMRPATFMWPTPPAP